MTEERPPLWVESSPAPGRQYGDASVPRRDQAALRRPGFDPHDLAGQVLAGSRGAIARSITLVESSKPAHHAMAADLLRVLRPHTGRAVRVGITGVPGAGKSTFIDALGRRLIAAGHRIAVLAVDPDLGQDRGFDPGRPDPDG